MFESSARSTFPPRSPVGRFCLIIFLALVWLALGSLIVAHGQSCTGPSLKAASNIDAGVNNPNDLAVGDLNGDGNADIAVSGGGDNYVSVLFGHGTGAFESPLRLPGYGTSSLAIGDFNGDGRQDLAVASLSRARVLVFSGNASGGLDDAVEYSIGGFNIRNLVGGDFNNNGKPDLAASKFPPGVREQSDIGRLNSGVSRVQVRDLVLFCHRTSHSTRN